MLPQFFSTSGCIWYGDGIKYGLIFLQPLTVHDLWPQPSCSCDAVFFAILAESVQSEKREKYNTFILFLWSQCETSTDLNCTHRSSLFPAFEGKPVSWTFAHKSQFPQNKLILLSGSPSLSQFASPGSFIKYVCCFGRAWNITSE